jgi:hypothetical protein
MPLAATSHEDGVAAAQPFSPYSSGYAWQMHRRWPGLFDGNGFALAPDRGAAAVDRKAARGLRNMQNRAARCGAELKLIFRAGGTRLRLKLPRCVLDSDAAAG